MWRRLCQTQDAGVARARSSPQPELPPRTRRPIPLFYVTCYFSLGRYPKAVLFFISLFRSLRVPVAFRVSRLLGLQGLPQDGWPTLWAGHPPKQTFGDCNVYYRTHSWSVTRRDPCALRVLIASVDIAGPGYTQRASIDAPDSALVSGPRGPFHDPSALYHGLCPGRVRAGNAERTRR